jgi:acylphosphatase
MSESPTSLTRRRLEAVVHGRVQGVGFRVFVFDTARRLGLVGWVANEAGRRVRCVAEGREADLDRLLERLRSGPPGAFVERVDATWSGATDRFAGFEIRSGWHAGD